MNNEIMTSSVNSQIEYFKDKLWFNPNDISDWYHTFGQLYKHRIHLFIALCKVIDFASNIDWRDDTYYRYKAIKSKKHFDWSEYEWWFIIQLETPYWQISYHLPNEYWDKCNFIEIKDKANEWDWHDSDIVLERLLEI